MRFVDLLSTLCAMQLKNCIVDILAVLFIFIVVSVCAQKGFIKCFFGTISTILALVVAFSFTKGFINITGGMFGLSDLLQGKLEGAFAKINGFGGDISAQGVEAAIEEQNLPAILARLVMKTVGNQDSVPAGTTLAMLLGEATSGLAMTLIAGITLFIVTKLLLGFLKGTLIVISDSIDLMHSTDVLLGAVVGFLEGLLIICSILAVLTVFPNEKITEFLTHTIFIGELYAKNPLVTLLGTMI